MSANGQAGPVQAIGLWRRVPRLHPITSSSPAFPARAIFPGGRHALSHGLFHAGLRRPNRVAFPEWSSYCVVSALAKYVTPVPMREAAERNLKVDGVLLYEQWGWGFPLSTWEQLAEKYRDTVLIVDRVDSGDFFRRTAIPVGEFKSVAQVLSLWKALGLPGGGLLHAESGYIEFEPDTAFLSPITELLTRTPGIEDRADHDEYFKSQAQVLHPALAKWLRQNSLLDAAEDERGARRENSLRLYNSSLGREWPAWMAEALDAGGGPGIAPVLRGASDAELTEAVRALQHAGIHAAVYHFDWSGNPLSPSYEPCLALPVHGLMCDLESVLTVLGKFVPTQRTRKTG